MELPSGFLFMRIDTKIFVGINILYNKGHMI